MTINNMDAYMGNLWDWGFLNDCFGGTKIRVSDIDGIVERNGQFLVLEAKSPGVEIKGGQKILFKRMAASGTHTVLVIWGKPGHPERYSVFSAKCPGGTVPKLADETTIRELVRDWYKKADGKLFG